MQVFDPLKSKLLIESEFKLLHITKEIQWFIFFPNENTKLRSNKMLRIYEDFDLQNCIGHGSVSCGEKATTLDLYLNYGIPIRLDLENDQEKAFCVFIDPKKLNADVLDCVLEDAYATNNTDGKLVLQFTLKKEDLKE